MHCFNISAGIISVIMIGVSMAIGHNASSIKSLAKKEDWHYNKSIVSHKEIDVNYSGYNGYPIDYWSFKDSLIIFEGIAYNYEDDERRLSINDIVNDNCKREDITRFVNNADGDFCVYIINLSEKRAVIFNDILGGLPVFYSIEDNTVLISRQFGWIVTNIKERKWSSRNIAEFLKFGYNMRKRTFSDVIFKMEPASMITIDYSMDQLEIKYDNLYIDDFSIKNRYKSREEAVSNLADLFLESCKRRISYAKSHGFEIVNTMSGGFDSRTVLGGIEKYTNDYINLTYAYIRDESLVAKQVLQALNSQSEYVKLNFKNNPDLYNKKFTINTDGRINVFTNSVCYHDMQSVREFFGDRKVLYFGGFGGEFIRHPRHVTLLPFSKIGLYYTPTYELISKICKTNVGRLTSMFSDSFSNTKGATACKYKDLYNEYYENLVRCSGEDRTRMFYFTVQPMMGKDFIMAIRHRVPLKWAGFEFYKRFLEAIDKRLVSVSVWGQNPNYLDNNNLRKVDFKKRVVEKYISPLRVLYHKFKKNEFREMDNEIKYADLELQLKALRELNLFDETFISSKYQLFNKAFKYKLITIISYIYEIERMSK